VTPEKQPIEIKQIDILTWLFHFAVSKLMKTIAVHLQAKTAIIQQFDEFAVREKK